ncbi:hypothetical protein GOB86_12580 [Acetobacter lambici]|uniref:Uncharacterized protein n=1 Tax=Acetobacter lambici TaxID=1332824 RepID=A0ABT1F153_9PROT|nr:hypothetical protein [Acetobacter lambici]MCP1242772.1 hypothetical protein [Acetobacter lambici]MCP1258942.1 hypothetical protein [Acetobacter lambici]NHO57880.1 hypothetical protein [Acetobacter lambici]
MMRLQKLCIYGAMIGMSLASPSLSWADASGCKALVQAAATGKAAQIKTDDAMIQQPESVTKFTCLGNFFNGLGLDVLTNGLDISSIAQSAMGKICDELSNVWDTLESAAQCGLNVSSFDDNFNLGLGAGSICPTLNFGGGGDELINTGVNSSGTSSYSDGRNSYDVNGSLQLPDGYSLGDASQAFGLSGGTL